MPEESALRPAGSADLTADPSTEPPADLSAGQPAAAARFAVNGRAVIGVVNDLRTWFLILAVVSIGLEFRVAALREAGWRPIAVFASATVFNLLVALGLASLLFRNFSA
jgi:hypothetical protein